MTADRKPPSYDEISAIRNKLGIICNSAAVLKKAFGNDKLIEDRIVIFNQLANKVEISENPHDWIAEKEKSEQLIAAFKDWLFRVFQFKLTDDNFAQLKSGIAEETRDEVKHEKQGFHQLVNAAKAQLQAQREAQPINEKQLRQQQMMYKNLDRQKKIERLEPEEKTLFSLIEAEIKKIQNQKNNQQDQKNNQKQVDKLTFLGASLECILGERTTTSLKEVAEEIGVSVDSKKIKFFTNQLDRIYSQVIALKQSAEQQVANKAEIKTAPGVRSNSGKGL